ERGGSDDYGGDCWHDKRQYYSDRRHEPNITSIISYLRALSRLLTHEIHSAHGCSHLLLLARCVCTRAARADHAEATADASHRLFRFRVAAEVGTHAADRDYAERRRRPVH